jgi:peptide subunit release factor RF-3
MAMENARGISITLAALQFDYCDHVINLVDTRAGDTVYVGKPIEYPPVPTFAPENFHDRRVSATLVALAVPQGHRTA